MAKRPEEIEVLRRLVRAQDSILLAYRTSTRTPSKAIDEAARCRRWLELYARERAARAE
jgi:hypothetical protein